MTAKIQDFVIRGKVEGENAEVSKYLQDHIDNMYDVENVEIVVIEQAPHMSIDAMTGNED